MKPKHQRFYMFIMGALLLIGAVVLMSLIIISKRPKKEEKTTQETAVMEEEKRALSDEEAVLKYSLLPAGTVITKEELSYINPMSLFYVEDIPEDVFSRMNGVSFHEEGIMLRSDLRYIRLLHVGFDGETHIGELVVNASLANEVCDIFRKLYDANYQIESVCLVDDFEGDDHASMVANNTSAFNYRVVDDSDSLSNHAYGAAIDINPLYNPYVTKKGVSPIEGEEYADRTKEFEHKIDENELCYQLFTEAGYTWGGSWKSVKDYQHFEKEEGLSISGSGTEESSDANNNAEEKKYVVVIDPGHGGDNLGADAYGPIEKDMTLVTAQAMYASLSQYDNVEVYMTRTTDASLSLEDRVKYATKKKADLLVSLHYNASDDHERYGSEVLVSTSAPYNAYGYQLGVIQLEQMKSTGMFIRGIKCKSGKKGDYYGLLRNAADAGLTAVIFEHCFLDQADDHNRCASTTQQQVFGTQDAIAVAKYLGLYSTSMKADYRNYAKVNVDPNAIVPVTVNHNSGPDALWLSVLSTDATTGIVQFSVHGVDSDDTILYYDYSLDGGKTFSTPRSAWPETNPVSGSYATDFQFALKLSPGVNNSIVFRAFNMFDESSQTEPITINW